MKANLKSETDILAKIHIHDDYILVFGGLDKQLVKVNRFNNEIDVSLKDVILVYELRNPVNLNK